MATENSDSTSAINDPAASSPGAAPFFHEPNPGFKALLSQWKGQDDTSGPSALARHVATSGVAKRKTRDQARQEYRKKSILELQHKQQEEGEDESGAATSVDNAAASTGTNSKSLTKKGKKAVVAAMRFDNVYQQPLPANVAELTKQKSEKNVLEKELLLSALAKNFVFSDLDRKALMPLVDAFEACSFQKGDVIIKQGDPGDYFYVIKSGKVAFQVNGNDVGSAGKGASFGELSLLYTCPRAATVVAGEPSHLFRVDQNSFRYILQSQTQKSEQGKKALLQNVDFLKNLTSADIAKLSSVMTPRVFQENDVIVKKGDTGDAFYIIESGSVKITDISVGSTAYEDQVLGPGEYFGERSLATSEPRAANVVGATKGVAFSIDRATFEKVLGKMSDVIMRAQDARKLAGVPALKKIELDGRQITSLANQMDDKKFSSGQTIMALAASTPAALYFIREGKVELSENDSIVAVIQEGGFFGEPTFGDEVSVTAPYTARALEDTVCGILTVEGSKSVFDTSLLVDDADVLMEDVAEMHVSITTDASLRDLQRHKILGEGTFGQVWLVSEELPGGERRPYALKIQSKYDLAKEGQIKAAIEEKKVMQMMKHPFIIKLVKTFQDENLIYILLEMVQGGELFSVLHMGDEVGMPESQAKFYTLCVADALAYMVSFVEWNLCIESIAVPYLFLPCLISSIDKNMSSEISNRRIL